MPKTESEYSYNNSDSQEMGHELTHELTIKDKEHLAEQSLKDLGLEWKDLEGK